MAIFELPIKTYSYTLYLNHQFIQCTLCNEVICKIKHCITSDISLSKNQMLIKLIYIRMYCIFTTVILESRNAMIPHEQGLITMKCPAMLHIIFKV